MKIKFAPMVATALLLSTAAQADEPGVGHSRNNANAVDPTWCPGTRTPPGVPYRTIPWLSLCWNSHANL